MKKTNKTILVTGGAGYIGSHVCKRLFEKGFSPVVLDNLSVGHKYAVKWGPLIHADILNRKSLDLAISAYKPIAVMHFAANAYVGESVIDPGKYYRNNVAGTINLLEALRDHHVKNFIFSSTCATYGDPQEIPMNENHPQSPINPYGKSKLMIEQVLEDFSFAHHLCFASLRYFNAAGADLDTEIGEHHENETHLIPLVLQAAIDSSKEIGVFGDDYPTEDGTAIRDYIHVTDLADAHICALEYLLREKENIKVNLGTGKGFSVKEIIHAVESLCRVTIKKKITKRRAGDPPSLIANNKQALKKLQWEPKFSDMETIISSAWKWQQKLEKKEVLYEKVDEKKVFEKES